MYGHKRKNHNLFEREKIVIRWFMRYLAESNCPTRFCRPLPNRSAKVP